MRAGAVLNATAMAAPAADVGHSRWHSPVPYLFGGLAAMLGLIAFALLLLACSYWKLSRRLLEEDLGGAEAEGKTAAEETAPQVCYEDKVVVIMAGEETPTYLATLISSRASSFGDGRARKDEEKDCREVEQLCTIQQRESQNLCV